MRPRVLYFAVFVYFSLSGGRFTATFLEHELQFTENWMVSCAMAIQLLTASLCSSWLGGVADSWEESRGGKNRGRLLIMSLGLTLSTIATLLHIPGSLFWVNNGSGGIQSWQNNPLLDMNVDGGTDMADSQQSIPLPLLAYHLFLRAIYAIGKAGITPVLDGLTLAQLEREGRDKQEYGKERVYGAVSWGIAHILFGPAIDLFGFKVLYATILLSWLGCIITFHLYAKSSGAYCIGSNEVVATCQLIDEKKYRDDQVAIIHDDLEDEKKTPDEPIATYESTVIFEEDGSLSNNDTNANSEHSAGRLSFWQLLRFLFEKAPVLNVSYIIAVFALWAGMSVVESLIFLYFEFLGGSNIMCGFTVAVTVLFELPLFHYAPEVLKWLGSSVSMLQWAATAYIVRAVGYSLIPQSHPYWVLLLEPLHGITIAFASTSSVDVASSWVPRGYESSGQGFLSMIGQLGQFVGLCIAGYLDGRTLYRVLAAVVTVGASILAMGNHYATRKKDDCTYESIR